jgi:hypothetical protein
MTVRSPVNEADHTLRVDVPRMSIVAADAAFDRQSLAPRTPVIIVNTAAHYLLERAKTVTARSIHHGQLRFESR